MHHHLARLLLAATLSSVLAGGLAACGDDAASSNADTAPAASSAVSTTPAADPADVDRAFVRQMIPHHEMAVDMAEIAAEEGQHAEIKTLAAAVIAAQNAEIDQLKELAKPLDAADYDAPEKMEDDAAALGLPMDQMGMDMDASSLKGAAPFDLAFIDAMIAHHTGAIAMAKAQLAGGANPAVKRLATAIVAEQQQEVAQMLAWRKAWGGATTPTTPGAPGGHDMDHGDMAGE